jgi:hypothetical protein
MNTFLRIKNQIKKEHIFGIYVKKQKLSYISFFFLQDFIGYIYKIKYKNHNKYLITKYRNFHDHKSKVYTHRQSLNFS